MAAPTPTPTPSATSTGAAVAKGTVVCSIADTNAVELSGLAQRNGIFYLLNDGDDNPNRRKVFKVKQDCTAAGTALSYPAQSADPEDIALGPDGVLYIGDIGDNGVSPALTPNRPSIAIWKIGADEKIDGPYRYAYPDGKYNAEALLIGSDGLPIIITKGDGGSKPRIYTATALATQKASSTPTPLKLVGELTLPKTETQHIVPAFKNFVTSAALSPTRDRVVVRTYTDAFEFAVTNNDIVGSIRSVKPKVTAMPSAHVGELGEAITYSADGTKFLTVSETYAIDSEKDRKPAITSWVPNTVDATEPAANTGTLPETEAKSKGLIEWATETPKRIYMLIGSVGVLGLLLVGVGVFGILKARKKTAENDEDEDRKSVV